MDLEKALFSTFHCNALVLNLHCFNALGLWSVMSISVMDIYALTIMMLEYDVMVSQFLQTLILLYF